MTVSSNSNNGIKAFTGLKAGTTALAIVFALAAPLEAVAKPGGGGSSGSRGTRTYSAPAATQTAPKTAAPIERTATPSPAAPSTAGAQSLSSPPRAAAPAPVGSRFGTGLMAGLLGAGLLGAMMGHGFGGGLGGFMSAIGLMLQLLLVAGIVMLAIRWFRNRSQPAMAGAGNMRRDAMSGMMGNAAQRAPQPRAEVNRPVQIGPADFANFEKLLNDIQTSYSAEDMGALRKMVTLEMSSYFSEELADNARKGQVNRITDVKLLQGDLSEAWGEPGNDYATVAMRFALTDVMLERASGKPVSSHNNGPQEATELWTFIRPSGGSWTLSAIQQAG